MNLSLVRSSPEAEGGLVDNAMRAINQRIRGERLRVGDPVPSEAGLAAESGFRAPSCAKRSGPSQR